MATTSTIQDSSKINLGLPDFPPNELDPGVYSALSTVHNAIKNLWRGVSQYAGVDSDPKDIWGQLSLQQTLLSANLQRMYPVATVAINAGQVVNLFDSSGLKARLAVATGGSTMAHGIAMTSAAPGERFMMYFLRGYVDTVGGMVTGSMYYLSTAPGFIQTARPAVAGQIIQPIGLAYSASQLMMDISTFYQQL